MRLDGDYTRDEREQAAYLHAVLDVRNAEGIDTAFVCPSRPATCRTA